MEAKSKILLIDDEEVVIDSCAQILAGGPYELASASDGTAGLRLAGEFDPDLVFVDLKMPGISGFEVLEKIRDMDPAIVTVVITGFATVSSAVDAMKKGAYDFLPKPFTPEEFRLITRRSLEKRRLTLETIALRREKEMLREHFAHIVSHELKAPLGAVQQLLFALEFEASDSLGESQKEKLTRIKIRIEDMLNLINSWLRVFSVDVNKLKENFKPIPVAIPISKALENVESLAARKNIEIISSISGGVGFVNGDILSLSEALVNVLGNAIKYSNDDSKIYVMVEESGNEVSISVQDAGIGIAREDLPHIFEGFHRGKEGRAAAAGAGIGLAVCRQIIEAHNGSIAVESELGKGSVFMVRLPAVEPGTDPKSDLEAVGMAKS
jgi:signal transduction histidine kinase